MSVMRIDDQEYIGALFNGLSKQKEIPMSLFFQDKQHFNKMTFNYKKKGSLNVLIENKKNVFLPQNINFDVVFVHEDVLFRFTTSVVESKENQLVIQKPESIFSNFRRLVKRYYVKEDENFYIIFEGDSKKFKLVDISLKGLSFVCNERFLFEGQSLTDIKIILPDESKVYISGEVRHCKEINHNEYSYGINFLVENLNLYQKLFNYLLKRTYPDIKSLNDCSIDELHTMYSSSKALSYKITDSNEQTFMGIVNNFYKLKDKSIIFSSIINFKNDTLLNIGSILRLYSKTFVHQQLLSTQEAELSPKAKCRTLMALANIMINHPYFEYCIIYNEDFSFNTIFEKISEFANDKNRILVEELEHYECNTTDNNEVNLSDEYGIMILKKSDQFIEYCKKNLYPIEINCYDYNIENFNLDKMKEIYESLDLLVSRRLWAVHKNSNIVAFVVAEVYSDVINIDCFSDTARIYFVENSIDLELVFSAVLPELKSFYARYGKEKFKVFYYKLR